MLISQSLDGNPFVKLNFGEGGGLGYSDKERTSHFKSVDSSRSLLLNDTKNVKGGLDGAADLTPLSGGGREWTT